VKTEDSRISSQPEVEARSANIEAGAILALAVPAIVLFAGFMWLGFYVKTHAEPAALWAFAQSVRGHAIGLAWALTNLCYPYVLAPLCVISLVVGIVSPRWRVPAFLTVAVLLVCWGGVDQFQHFFARPRRTDWLVKHELSFSYPSSHAAISIGFYFFWGLVLLRSRLATWLRVGAFVVLTALTLGIIWSRLSLGAHYPTDVIGGAMFGAVIILLAAALVQTAGGRLLER